MNNLLINSFTLHNPIQDYESSNPNGFNYENFVSWFKLVLPHMTRGI